MNEFYAADPICLKSARDLQYLFGLFGPCAGRYLAAYPMDWRKRVLGRFSHLSDVELERVKTIIRRAKEETAFLENSSLPWDLDKSWIDNALDVKKSPKRQINEVIGSGEERRGEVLPFDELEIPPTAEERIEGQANEFERVCRTLIKLSPELFLVDPYLSPCKNDIRPILGSVLRLASKGKCCSVVCYGRTSNVLGARLHSWDEVTAEWQALLMQAEWPKTSSFRYLLIDDDQSRSKMHARYLFSIKGGIRLDQGFQRLPRGRKMDVSPVAKVIHEELLQTYLDRESDMVIEHEWCIGPA